MCDLCAERTAKGKKPTCVKHCQAFCMEYGPVEELAQKMATAKTKQVLFVPQYKPYEARGKFVSQNAGKKGREAAAIEIVANEQVEFATHRDDADVRSVNQINEK